MTIICYKIPLKKQATKPNITKYWNLWKIENFIVKHIQKNYIKIKYLYIIYNEIVKIIEPEAGPPFTSYNSSLHNALL